jgi:hypothetical protein
MARNWNDMQAALQHIDPSWTPGRAERALYLIETRLDRRTPRLWHTLVAALLQLVPKRERLTPRRGGTQSRGP